MPALIPPTPAVHESFLKAMAEFQAEGRGADGSTRLDREVRDHGPTWNDPAGFAAFLDALRAQSLEETPRPEGWAPYTTLWWVEGDEYLGALAIRHHVDTPFLLDFAGHIGYDVRPSARRRGHATAMLRASLPVARAMGIDRVLVTCHPHNEGSRRTIENCGGTLEDQRGPVLRYWVPTA